MSCFQAKKSKTAKDSEEFGNNSSKPCGPPNAFMLFINDFRGELREQFPSELFQMLFVSFKK